MMVRRNQMDAFRTLAMDEFVEGAVQYLDRALDQTKDLYGKDAVVATVHYGVERARLHGFVTQHDVCLYLRLMFTLMGSDFDRDPLYPWAAETLNDLYYPPNERIMRLSGRADQFLSDVQQNEVDYFKKLLTISRSNQFTRLPDGAEPPMIKREALVEIRRWFPAKLAAVGEENASRMIGAGLNDAWAQGMRRASDTATFILFLFVHGTRFYSDPKYPEVQSIFSDINLSGSQKVDAMFSAARGFLGRKLYLLRLGEE